MAPSDTMTNSGLFPVNLFNSFSNQIKKKKKKLHSIYSIKKKKNPFSLNDHTLQHTQKKDWIIIGEIKMKMKAVVVRTSQGHRLEQCSEW